VEYDTLLIEVRSMIFTIVDCVIRAPGVSFLKNREIITKPGANINNDSVIVQN